VKTETVFSQYSPASISGGARRSIGIPCRMYKLRSCYNCYVPTTWQRIIFSLATKTY